MSGILVNLHLIIFAPTFFYSTLSFEKRSQLPAAAASKICNEFIFWKWFQIQKDILILITTTLKKCLRWLQRWLKDKTSFKSLFQKFHIICTTCRVHYFLLCNAMHILIGSIRNEYWINTRHCTKFINTIIDFVLILFS